VISKTRILIIIIIGGLFLFFWDNPYLLPLKLFVVLIHEICHALTALIFGGDVKSIVLHLDESGFTKAETTLDSSFILMVSSGYIGSTFIGGFLLNRGLKGKWVFGSLFTLGLLTLTLSLKFVLTELNNVTIMESAFLSAVFGICWGLFFLISANFGKQIGRTILIFVGTLSSIYCLYDFGDFVRGVENTDAGILASYLLQRPFPKYGESGYDFSDSVVILAYMVAVIWVLITLTILFLMIRNALNIDKKKLNQGKEGPEFDESYPPEPYPYEGIYGDEYSQDYYYSEYPDDLPNEQEYYEDDYVYKD
jgi:hypothetical protein